MDNNFIHPETKKPGSEEAIAGSNESRQEQPGALERSNQNNADHEARLEAARQILELRPDAETPAGFSADAASSQNPEVGYEETQKQFKENLNAIVGGDANETKRVLDASQMDVPELAGLIRENKAPHTFEGVSPDKLVDALGKAADEKPDYPIAA
jgi:hypothetical protein